MRPQSCLGCSRRNPPGWLTLIAPAALRLTAPCCDAATSPCEIKEIDKIEFLRLPFKLPASKLHKTRLIAASLQNPKSVQLRRHVAVAKRTLNCRLRWLT